MFEKFIKNVLRGDKGFSLAEIMVAAGLLGVVSLGVMQMTTRMHKTQKNTAQKANANELLLNLES